VTLPVTPSQTIGPFFAVQLCWPDGPEVVPAGTPGAVWVGARVTDGDGLRFDLRLQGDQETPFLAI
jgi:protocatechuate 3,4-dioxygenase alpha subunit